MFSEMGVNVVETEEAEPEDEVATARGAGGGSQRAKTAS